MVWAAMFGAALEHDRFLRRAVPVPGELAEVVFVAGAKTGPDSVRMTYRYTTPGGRTLTGNRFRLGQQIEFPGFSIPNAPLETAERARLQSRYSQGPITVYLDPDQPEHAVVDLHRPAAPFIGMSLAGLATSVLGGVVVAVLTGAPAPARRVPDGWVVLPPTRSLTSRAFSMAMTALLALPLAAAPAVVPVFGDVRSTGSLFVASGVLLVAAVVTSAAIYFLWQWRRIRTAQLQIRPGSALPGDAADAAPGVLRGEPFGVRLLLETHGATVRGGDIQLLRQKRVLVRSGTKQQREWVTQETWSSPLSEPIGPEIRVRAETQFTVPTDRPPTSPYDRYRLVPKVHLARGPDYRQEFPLRVE